MAVIFIKDISTTDNLMAFNNNVVTFYSNTTSKVVLNAVVTINTNDVVLYPSPTGNFYFNFKEYITSLINTNNFTDTVEPELSSLDDTTLTYVGVGDFTDVITFRIYFTDETSETATRNLNFINGVEQLTSYKKNESQTGSQIILSPLIPQTNNHYYVKYWEGFPFDVSFLDRDYPDEDPNLELDNLTNLLSYPFLQKSTITRLFFCDGSTDETITDFLPMALGINEIQWLDKYLIVDKQDVCSGVYLKWLNQYGGWSYWNFGNIYRQNQTTRSKGEINTDFWNLSDTFSQTSEIGKDGGERITINSDNINENELSVLKSLLTSPKVYLFTGEPFSRASVNDWVEVKIIPSTYTTRNYKGQSPNLTFDIELPDLYTQSL